MTTGDDAHMFYVVFTAGSYIFLYISVTVHFIVSVCVCFGEVCFESPPFSYKCVPSSYILTSVYK